LAGQPQDAPEGRQRGQDRPKADDGQIAQGVDERAAGLRHALAAEADHLGVRPVLAQGADEVGAVQVAAGVAGAHEDAHGGHPARWGTGLDSWGKRTAKWWRRTRWISRSPRPACPGLAIITRSLSEGDDRPRRGSAMDESPQPPGAARPRKEYEDP